jgi:hypothetical protein
MPVSRPEHLAVVFAALETLECDRGSTNLLCLVDGSVDLFLQTREFVQNSKFAQRLCIQRKPSKPVYSKQARRIRISTLHNELKQHIGACDYVFGLEDDGIPRPDALHRLLRVYSTHPFAGLVTGVEIGRWGVASLGLYRVDDVYEPTTITSVMLEGGIQEVDACGMYGFLTKRDNYVNHEFRPFGNNDLGPDVQFSLALRQSGYRNYVDFGVPVEHRRTDGTSLTPGNTKIEQVRLIKESGNWSHGVVK